MPQHNPEAELIRKLFTTGQPLVYGKDDVILGNDPEPNGMYYIESGYVKNYTISDDGDQLLHVIYGPGELFPMIWAYLGNDTRLSGYNEYYEALSTCTVWRLANTWFRRFITTNVSLSFAVATQMARQFRIYSDRIENLEYKSARQRVAYRLLFLAERFGVSDKGTITIEAPITHEIFANSINLARESVSRELEKLEKEGLVKRTDAHLKIRSSKDLAACLRGSQDMRNWRLNPAEQIGSPIRIRHPVPARARA